MIYLYIKNFFICINIYVFPKHNSKTKRKILSNHCDLQAHQPSKLHYRAFVQAQRACFRFEERQKQFSLVEDVTKPSNLFTKYVTNRRLDAIAILTLISIKER